MSKICNLQLCNVEFRGCKIPLSTILVEATTLAAAAAAIRKHGMWACLCLVSSLAQDIEVPV